MIGRRAFAGLGLLACALAAVPLLGCAAGGSPDSEDSPRTQVPEGGDAGASRGDEAANPAGDEAFSLVSGHLCVAEYANNAVAVLDAATGELLRRIPVGLNPATLACDGENLYVGCSGSGEVWSVPLADTSAVRAIPVGDQPLGLCCDPARGLLYVGDYFSSCVHVVDTALGSVVGSVVLSREGYRNRTDPPDCCRTTPGVGRRPVALAMDPEGDVLFCADYGTYDLARVDLATRTEIEAFDGVVGPRELVVAPDGSRLLLAGVGGESEQVVDSLYAIDCGTGRRLAQIAVGPGVSGVCLAADGASCFAVSRDDGTVVRIHVESGEELARAAALSRADMVAASPDGSSVFAADGVTGTLVALDASTLEVAYEVTGLVGPKDLLVV